MSRLQPIYDIAQICSLKSLSQVVLCPGSRCAPLTLAFSRHPKMTTRIFADERSAGFIALGMAQQSGRPAILVCTSGSATYNFAPAVAEAYFSHTPLILFTADRPVEWIDQLDGQTIRQKNIYGSHVKKAFELPQEYDHPDDGWHINRIVNEAINLAQEFPPGPVHINVPLREPFYPAKDEKISFSETVSIMEEVPAVFPFQEQDQAWISKALNKFTKILLVGGQASLHDRLLRHVQRFSKNHNAPIVGDIISNLHPLSQSIKNADAFLGQCSDSVKKSLQPELLITFGQSVISKNVKQFLRKYKPLEHWHLQEAGAVADTFQSLTKIIRCSPSDFFETASEWKRSAGFEAQKRENFARLWEAEDHRAQRSKESFFSSPSLSEFFTISQVLKDLPARCNLHLANSMSVRYANFIGIEAGKKGIRVFSNRGTSGIDGCTSTAMGHALLSDIPNILITGDMAFLYDRNAFWHNYRVPNLHILLLNNHGGAIFGMIDGPRDLPEAPEYFITKQNLTGQHLASEFGVAYAKVDNLKKIRNAVKDFLEFEGTCKILEIESTPLACQQVFEKFKKAIRQGYET